MKNNKVHFKVALPTEVKYWLSLRAATNMRSQSSELICILKDKMVAGEQIGVEAPATSNNNTALQGGASINQDKRTI